MAHTRAIPNSIRAAPVVLDYVFGPQKPPADYAVAGGAMSVLRPSHFFATSTDFRAVDGVMRDQQSRYAELRLPVGVLFGTADRVVDWERHGKALEGAVAGLELEALEGVGHMPQYAETERVVGFVRRIAEKASNRLG